MNFPMQPTSGGEAEWNYILNGKQYGPYSGSQMAEWEKGGWFRDDSLVRLNGDDSFYPLGQYRRACNGGSPFDMPTFVSMRAVSMQQAAASGGDVGFNNGMPIPAHPMHYYPPQQVAPQVRVHSAAHSGFNVLPTQLTAPQLQQFPYNAPPHHQYQQHQRMMVMETPTPPPPGPVHRTAETQTELIEISLDDAQAVLSELLKLPLKVVHPPPPSASSSASMNEE